MSTDILPILCTQEQVRGGAVPTMLGQFIRVIITRVVAIALIPCPVQTHLLPLDCALEPGGVTAVTALVHSLICIVITVLYPVTFKLLMSTEILPIISTQEQVRCGAVSALRGKGVGVIHTTSLSITLTGRIYAPTAVLTLKHIRLTRRKYPVNFTLRFIFIRTIRTVCFPIAQPGPFDSLPTGQTQDLPNFTAHRRSLVRLIRTIGVTVAAPGPLDTPAAILTTEQLRAGAVVTKCR
jgi:hypothetical protein